MAQMMTEYVKLMGLICVTMFIVLDFVMVMLALGPYDEKAYSSDGPYV